MKKLLVLLAATSALTACNHDQAKHEPMTEEQVQMIIDNYIEENPGKIIDSLNAHMAKMQAEAQEKQFEEMMKNPVKSEITKDTPVKGADDAIITIVEFSDFECPFCTKVNPTLDAVMKRYEGKVKLAYKHLALPFHANAESAALASVAANKQGKFWEFHDELFKNQANLGEETYIKIAKSLKLDLEQFKKDMTSKEALEIINKDMQEAQKLGINGTPGFIINGVPVSGALPESEFVKVIEKLLDTINK